MRVLGITAEYNPFHNGHAYHIREAKARTGCDSLIVLQSGNFVQRGTPAIMDKYARAEAALKNGADIVIELPVYSATASAELFAEGAIRAFRDLQVAEISYGIECDTSEETTVEAIEKVASYLSEEPEEYKLLLKKGLSEGLPFASARWHALSDLCPAASSLSSTPNNILGIEYEKAKIRLKANFKSLPITRKGCDYHDSDSSAPFASATAIREAFLRNEYPAEAIPDNLLELYREYTSCPVSADDFNQLLFSLVYGRKTEELAEYFDVSPDLAKRMLSRIPMPFSWNRFAEAVKDRSHARSHIDRALCHILLDIKKKDAELYRQSEHLPYLHVLGMRSGAENLLGYLSNQCAAPLLVRVNKDIATLPSESQALFEKELRSTALYRQVIGAKGSLIPEERSRKFLIV